MVKNGILVLSDVQDVNSAATSMKKAELVLTKIAGSLDACISEPFYKLITVMKSYGNDALKQLATIMERESSTNSTTTTTSAAATAAVDASTGKICTVYYVIAHKGYSLLFCSVVAIMLGFSHI